MLENLRRLRRIVKDYDRLTAELERTTGERDKFKAIIEGADAMQFVPAGHFYSPIPSVDDVRLDLERQNQVKLPAQVPAVIIDDAAQLELLEQLKQYYPLLPFRSQPTEGLLYFFDNPHYSYSDAIILFCLLNWIKPSRVIEIGSGHSTCAMVDTNRLLLDSRTKITCIEPYPGLLRSLLQNLNESVAIIGRKVQDVDLSFFDELEAGDILFVDSTHVSKIGSDVNRIFFEILPHLHSGVLVHIHDVFYPFEYPKEWVMEGRAWSEAYVVRAFLALNTSFEITLFNHWIAYFHRDVIERELPAMLTNTGGALWLRRVRPPG